MNPVTIPHLPSIIDNYSCIKPNVIFEIGASDGTDVSFLSQTYNVEHKNVHCFEPNPGNFSTLNNRYPQFNNNNVAVSNYNGISNFYMCRYASDVSSFSKIVNDNICSKERQSDYNIEQVNVIRIDSYIREKDIKSISICKIDVEGHSYEVLEGFGNQINIVESFHIEAEIEKVFENQILYENIKNFLLKNNFTIVDYSIFNFNLMCDSIWVRNDMLIKNNNKKQ